MEPTSAYEFLQKYEKKVTEAVEFLKLHVKEQPEFGIVLGSGLGDIANLISGTTLDYGSIPNFPRPTVQGHEGKMYIGTLDGVNVIGLKGRKHYYEVADEPYNTGILQVVFAVHVLAGLGVKCYLASNAVGGLNPGFKVGDLMIIRSHINQIPNPLLGRLRDFARVDEKPYERFQPMNDAYDPNLRDLFKKAAGANNDHVHEGVLLSVSGPSFETEAECVAFRDAFKADAVGMSITPEVIVARSRGMRCVAFSCITNSIDKNGRNAASHEEVVRILESREIKDRLSLIVQNFFRLYNKKGA